jgi:hypothetical protein
MCASECDVGAQSLLDVFEILKNRLVVEIGLAIAIVN